MSLDSKSIQEIWNRKSEAQLADEAERESEWSPHVDPMVYRRDIEVDGEAPESVADMLARRGGDRHTDKVEEFAEGHDFGSAGALARQSAGRNRATAGDDLTGYADRPNWARNFTPEAWADHWASP